MACVFSACRVDVRVDVALTARGNGDITVTAVFDPEAAEEAGDLTTRLRTEDLEDAGWIVEPPRPRSGGGVEQTLRRPFVSAAEANDVLDQLTGPAGPLGGLGVTYERGVFTTESSFGGDVDLRGGVEAFSDEKLREILGGQPLGVPVEELERRAGAPFAELFGLEVRAHLPGEEAQTWALRLGQQERIEAEGEAWNTLNLALFAVALAAATAMGVVLVRRRRLDRAESEPLP